MTGEEDFLAKLRETFQVEAEEHLQAIADALLRLEQSPPPAETASLVEQAFREMHSLKGAARAVNLGEAATLCQSMETTLASWKKGEISPEPSLFDQLHRGLDQVRSLLAIAPSARESVPAIVHEEKILSMSRKESPAANREAPPTGGPFKPAAGEAPSYHAPSFSETIRVSAAKL
ncbi:MAG: Hpt domain-containing protein, partial [bacterium]